MFVTAAYAQQSTTTEGAEAHDAPAAGEVHTETGVAHEAEHGSGVFPPFDSSHFASQLLWLAITFGLFYLLMSKVIIPRIGGILAKRHDRIAQDLDEASRLKGEADAAIASYEQELANARTKGHSIADTAREEAKSKATADRAAVEADLTKKITAAETRIADIKSKALADVGAIAEETATAVVKQLIGGNVTKTEIAAAVKASAGN
ncbi:F0F1 ATP synthase subunit B' [Sinorhizobium fredii USDA 205]|uniref:ATP synthase subunit b n=1 Tax=Rhizobium fredii TaxID=380 RepID=A0A844AD42_RHIFR|nr:F0F1 ATP synthase subunit B [Sinorhizobium fredii]AWM23845.1 ATP synthase B' chain [Sinorhizobium fredii CCBAU 25509]KSV88064.1 F0F1 ATP synthase subunit B' [Sinorhizobium fredii USDA 205]MQW93534.1 F0F1 ATP synthase subunit B [Sinorhizobium fredii]MQX09978.1 F0F1 ATP synthase subunit B [Sinorhizobium fredii]UTY48342.1 F0F1 ATP synthase subunit B [Sinorhizobium fredii]